MQEQDLLQRFDSWLAEDGPAAVVLREHLQPVEGPDGVVFPPTFAPAQGATEPYYVIDELKDGRTALVDTVGSQANRIEPVFRAGRYSGLVPKASIKVGERTIDLLDAGHRAADALVRFSTQSGRLSAAFRSIAQTGDATALAKLAPTSLVFGVWDSRDTQVKAPRLVSSTIRARGVEPLTRAAQYFSAFEKKETDELRQSQQFLSEQGFSDAPAGRAQGGVIARGGITRDAVLNLVALRAISGGTAEGTLVLQRYMLGLALAALTAPMNLYLRQGCLLVQDPTQPAMQEVVFRSGTREPFTATMEAVLEYAEAAAKAFGVGEDWTAEFQLQSVEAMKAKSEGKTKKAKAGA